MISKIWTPEAGLVLGADFRNVFVVNGFLIILDKCYLSLLLSKSPSKTVAIYQVQVSRDSQRP